MIKRIFLTLTLMAAIVASLPLISFLPNIHRSWLRSNVAEKVFEVRGVEDGGGGTGFAVQAPSGVSYILTNSHVCEYALTIAKSKNLVLVVKDGHYLKRRVLEISGESDLCLLEGWPGVKGLKLGSEASIGEVVYMVGHPKLLPTTMVSGEVTAKMDITMIHHVMGNSKLGKAVGGTDEACDLPKEKIVKRDFEITLPFLGPVNLGQIDLCLVTETDAYLTTIISFPGNSGSPVVNKWGHVIGVLFAGDNNTNWGSLVNFDNISSFLKDF